ncbi:ABC transporter substrate-binding protein [Kytococcus sp. Marseille-QA3725]
MRPARALTGLVAAGALVLTACGGDPTKDPEAGKDSGGGQGADTVTIGSANFTESTITAEVYAAALEDAGAEVEKKLEIGSRETYVPALQDGSIDLVPEYTGTLASYFDETTEATTPEEVYAALQENLPEGLAVLDYSKAENSDNVVVTRETAEEMDLQTISDLRGKSGEMVMGGPPEFQERPQGLPGLKKVYGVEFQKFRALAAGGNITVHALKNGQIDAANIFTTDPSIQEQDFVILEDDENLFSAQNVVPLLSEEAVTDTTEKALNEVSAQLTVEDLAEMNAEVMEGATPEEVADAWVEEKL